MVNTRPHLDSDGDNTAQAMKTTGGEIHFLHVVNTNAADAYFQLFDAATGDVTVGTTTPMHSFLVPAGNGSNAGMYELPPGVVIEFDNAITYACTTTATGNTDPTVGLVVNGRFR